MLLFPCPWCGPRDQSEFTYGREVTAIPALDASRAEWERYVFERDNPRGAHREWWHHNHGCRRWLVVTRDTLTHAVISVTEADSAAARTSPSSPSESGSALRAEPDSGKRP
jgi:sarcosine oxidase subunit delta